MGVFENKNFSKGTNGIGELLSKLNAFTLVGGGDSVSAINSLGIADKISYVSTGGGASLEFIEEGSLPGVNALKYGVSS
jgi:phosphoglycerate kinase